ncbi:MAG: 3-deoxy-manno-octulosonate cytidylyltransferase [Bryobacteraceae bacterium]
MPQQVLGVIPARLASTRFPAKALAPLHGKPILQHVWERASQARYLQHLLIATDDDTIATVARKFGAQVRMTSPHHPSGTDRVAEAASAYPHSVVVNIQGDEPLIDPSAIDAAVLALREDDDALMGTLAKRIEDFSEISNPNVVKVVIGRDGRALYFSRSPIPYDRGGGARYFKHIGLYVYRRAFLLKYPMLPVGPLEQVEKLEQLRALENGYKIRVAETEYESLGVDTPEDLARVEQLFGTRGVWPSTSS